MTFKKYIKIALFIIFLSIYLSCITIASPKPLVSVPSRALIIDDGMRLTVERVVANKESLYIGNELYKPMNPNSEICEMTVTFHNNSEEILTEQIQRGIELLVVKYNGATNYRPYTLGTTPSFDIGEIIGGESKSDVKAGGSKRVKIYFIYGKEYRPAALVYKRRTILNLLSRNDKFHSVVSEALDNDPN